MRRESLSRFLPDQAHPILRPCDYQGYPLNLDASLRYMREDMPPLRIRHVSPPFARIIGSINGYLPLFTKRSIQNAIARPAFGPWAEARQDRDNTPSTNAFDKVLFFGLPKIEG